MDKKWVNISIYLLVATQFVCWLIQHYLLADYFDKAIVGEDMAWRNYFTLNSLQGLSVFALIPLIPYAINNRSRFIKHAVIWLFLSSIYLTYVDWYYWPIRNDLKPYYYYAGTFYAVVIILVEAYRFYKRRKNVPKR